MCDKFVYNNFQCYSFHELCWVQPLKAPGDSLAYTGSQGLHGMTAYQNWHQSQYTELLKVYSNNIAIVTVASSAVWSTSRYRVGRNDKLT